jgi:hypothetical protein
MVKDKSKKKGLTIGVDDFPAFRMVLEIAESGFPHGAVSEFVERIKGDVK